MVFNVFICLGVLQYHGQGAENRAVSDFQINAGTRIHSISFWMVAAQM